MSIEKKGVGAMDSKEGKEKISYKTEYLTGIRPTGELTIANYIGAVAPLLDLQDKRPVVFVADLHAMTTNDPREVIGNVGIVVDSYLAFGLNPEKVEIFVQSGIESEVNMMAKVLRPLISVAEAIRQPALKDKVSDPTKANMDLLHYPVDMAADILLQDSHFIPVGDDQRAHVEISKVMARRLNERFGPVVAIPELYLVKEPPRIKALRKVDGKVVKMSKSQPELAILMTDSPVIVRKKIMQAETGFEGEKANPLIESLAEMAEATVPFKERDSVSAELSEFISKHEAGEKVMGGFKKRVAQITADFVDQFQQKRANIDPRIKKELLSRGEKKARYNAREVLQRLFDVGAISPLAKFW